MPVTTTPCPVRKQCSSPRAQKSWSELGRTSCVKIAVIAALLCFVFHGEIRRLFHLWVTDSSWSHGFLIPVFSLYFVNRRKGAILTARPFRPTYLGLPFLLLVLAFYVFNVASPAGYAYFRPVSMIAALGAVTLFLGGRRLIAQTWLPIVFLVFAVPLPRRLYVSMTMPMRQMAASVATAMLNHLDGVQASCSGVVIAIVHNGQSSEPALNVAEACSGMHLLMAFLALGVAMAYLHERPLWQRIVLLISTVPIAVLSNTIRVTATGFIYVLAGPQYTRGLYHDTLGLAMLPLAFGFYWALAWFMSALFIEEGHRGEPNVVVRTRSRA